MKDPDNFLVYLGDILERLHSKFYKEFDEMAKGLDIDEIMDIPTPDLKKLIPEMRHSVLKGTRVLFTGVIPTNMPPHKNREWNTARAFGAVIHDRLVHGLHSSDPNKAFRATTHVIAGRPGTSKLREAKRLPGVKVVNPRWLWSCAEQWKLVDEKLFPLEFEKEKSEEKQQGQDRETKSKSRSSEPPPRKVMKVVTEDSEKAKPPVSIPESVSTKATPTELQSIPPPTESTHLESTTPTLIEKTTELDSDSDSGDDDETFLTDDRLAEDVEKDPAILQRLREFKRHLSLESRLSVSDEELEKMDAEVEAEISSSESSNNGDEDLGTFIEEKDDDNLLSYENYAGSEASSKDKNELTSERLNRKRKHADIENNSSSSNSPSLDIDHLNDSIEPSDDEEEDGEGGEEEGGDSDDSVDELGALLG